MKTKEKKVFKSSFDEFISDPKNKVSFERAYRKFDRSETLIGAMQDAKISVRALAKKAGLSSQKPIQEKGRRVARCARPGVHGKRKTKQG